MMQFVVLLLSVFLTNGKMNVYKNLDSYAE
jgi:hypothetical protein